ncbi:MAG: heavy metal-associated domain-containing protein [Acidimicrobiales bacterium]|nr:heavy metal-associated domain-containing protein [Acidimicrobiales bacterium]
MSADTRTYTYTVPDISCDHCKRAIENHVTPLDGVNTVTIDIDTKTVTITGGDPSAIEAAIADAGYTIT